MKKSEVTWCRNFYWDNSSFELHQQWAGSMVDMSLSSHCWSPRLILQRCQFLQSNEQSIHVRAVRVIFITASRHGGNQICSIPGVSFLSESRLQMDYPNTWISWFTRQLDLELMFTSIFSLCTANWNKWAKLFTDLLAFSIGSTYSLALFTRFGGFTLWIYPLALFIWFGGFIYLPYLWALVSAYIVFILIANSVFLTSQNRTPLHFSQYTYPTFS